MHLCNKNPGLSLNALASFALEGSLIDGFLKQLKRVSPCSKESQLVQLLNEVISTMIDPTGQTSICGKRLLLREPISSVSLAIYGVDFLKIHTELLCFFRGYFHLSRFAARKTLLKILYLELLLGKV